MGLLLPISTRFPALSEKFRPNSTRLLCIALTLLGAGINYHPYEFLFGIQFIFGSICALLVLQLGGFWAGVGSGILTSGVTFYLWNHPYSIITMSAEIAIVGYLTRKKKFGLVEADTLFWIVLGLPLVYVFYHELMHASFVNVRMTIAKQVLNGIFNAAIARLLFIGYFSKRKVTFPLQEIIFNFATFTILGIALALLAIQGRSDRTRAEFDLQRGLLTSTTILNDQIQQWFYMNQQQIIPARRSDPRSAKDHNGLTINVKAIERILRSHLMNQSVADLQFTLVDRRNQIIASSYSFLKPDMPFEPKPGEPIPDSEGVLRWIPGKRKNQSLSERINNSYLIKEAMIGDRAEWKLYLEAPLAPVQKELFLKYTTYLLALFFTLPMALLTAAALSRRLSRSLRQLQIVSADVALRGGVSEPVHWPKTRIREARELISNFERILQALADQYKNARELNRTLEKRVTERTSQLAESRQYYRELINHAGDAIFVYDSKTEKLIDCNQQACRSLGYERHELLNLSIENLFPEASHSSRLRQTLKAGGSATIQIQPVRKDGGVFPAEVNMVGFVNKGYRRTIIAARDISERAQFETQLLQSLREKEILLQEIHHRVKNNMAVVSSLLVLQSFRLADPKAKQAFESTQKRISSMALVHQHLYGSNDLSRIELQKFISDLAANLTASYRLPDRELTPLVDAQNIFLPLAHAIPCALILNELITNAIKYAFSGISRPCLEIRVREVDGYFTVSVKDNGTGLPPDISPKNASSLGLQLVDSLVQQLNGKMEVLRSAGTEFVITFPTDGAKRCKTAKS